MASKVDLPLDEIIAKSKSLRGNRRGRGGRAGGRGVGGRGRGRVIGRGRSQQRGGALRQNAAFRSPKGNINGRWSHDMYYGGAAAVARSPVSLGPTKLNISNLDYGVSDSDIKELFSEFGNMRASAVHYDRSGRSLGTAHVIFDRRADAMKAIKQYNGVHLDRRPMNIVIDGETSGAGGGAARGTSIMNGTPRGRGFRRGAGARSPKRLQAGPRGIGGRGQRRGAVGGARRGGRGGGRRGGRGGRQKVPTAEELDKELDEYIFKSPK